MPSEPPLALRDPLCPQGPPYPQRPTLSPHLCSPSVLLLHSDPLHIRDTPISYPVLSYPILRYPTLSQFHPILFYPLLPYPIPSLLILSCPSHHPILIPSHPTLSPPIPSHFILSYPILSYPIPSHPNPIPYYLTLSYPALSSHPTLPHP